MKTIQVQVQDDHLGILAKTKPMTALAELIWNALDAEASEVRIAFETNEMEGLESLRVVDNGRGLKYDDALIAFRNLGGSWKREAAKSEELNRALHGQYGKGRFRAFTLGDHVEWRSTYADGDGFHTYSILGESEDIAQFSLSDPIKAKSNASGMTVEITRNTDAVYLLRGVKALQEVTDIFAPYLRQYPGAKIIYDGVPLDPSNSEAFVQEYDLGELVTENGDRFHLDMTVVEWNMPAKRGVLLCDEHGFMRHNALPRLHFRGFSYTAYVKSTHITVLDRQGLLQTGELTSDVRQILDAARAQLRHHFALREAELAQDVLEQWRAQELYPYDGKPRGDSESNERRIFDIYATHLNQIFPDFANAGARTKRLMLKLVQELISSDPTRMARLLNDILDFPEEKQDEVMELLGV